MMKPHRERVVGTGRKAKFEGGRVSVRLAFPTTFADMIYREVSEDQSPMTDLGAYYAILGWNQTHPPEEQVDMPSYLAALGRVTSSTPQPSLLSA